MTARRDPKPNPHHGPGPRRAWSLATVSLLCLLPLAAANLGVGVKRAFLSTPVDLSSRWQEVQYVLRGVDPNQLHFDIDGQHDRWTSGGLGPDAPPYHADLDRPGRPVPIGIYPPWTYTLAIPLHGPPTLAAAVVWFAFVNTACAGLLLVLIYRETRRRHGVPAARLATAGVGLISAVCLTFSVGNYGLVELTLLLLTLVALRTRRVSAAGLLLGFAAIKPTFAVPFGLLVLNRRDKRAAAISFGVVGVAVLAFVGLTRRNPLDTWLAAQRHLNQYTGTGGGLPQLIGWLGVPEPAGSAGLAAGVLAAAAAVLYRFRRTDLLVRAAIVGVAARLWCYHRHYDDLLLAFLLAGLLARAVSSTAQTRPSRSAALAAAGVGLTLWVPESVWGRSVTWQVLQHAAWLAGLAVLLRQAARETPADSARSSERCAAASSSASPPV